MTQLGGADTLLLAASVALCLHLAPVRDRVHVLALVCLVLITCFIVGLLAATVGGLFKGRLLMTDATISALQPAAGER